jgi:molybdopterin synthase sulfur carrier subunit
LIKVRVFGTLRQVVGTREIEVEGGAGDTVGEVLQRLLAACPGLEARVLDDQGHLRPAVNVFVRGRSITFRDGLDTALQEGEDIALFPPVAGG